MIRTAYDISIFLGYAWIFEKVVQTLAIAIDMLMFRSGRIIDILRFTYSFIYGTEVAWLHIFLCLLLMSKTSIHNEAAVNLKQFISNGIKRLIIAICVPQIYFLNPYKIQRGYCLVMTYGILLYDPSVMSNDRRLCPVYPPSCPMRSPEKQNKTYRQ